jgi:hypothetical protein
LLVVAISYTPLGDSPGMLKTVRGLVNGLFSALFSSTRSISNYPATEKLRWLTITQPVLITIPDVKGATHVYGSDVQLWLNFGERVQFYSEEGSNVRIRYAGEEILIPRSATDLDNR